MDGAAKQISTSTAEVFLREGFGPSGGGVPISWCGVSVLVGDLPSACAGGLGHAAARTAVTVREPRVLTGVPVISAGPEGNVGTVTAVARQPPVDCSRGGELELDRQRDHSVSLRHTGARPGPTSSTAAGTDSVLRRVSARQAATGHRLGRSVVALARLLAPGPSGGAEPPRRGSDARGERARRDCLWRWIRADGDSTGMYGCPRRGPGRPGGGVRPPALPSPRGGNSLAATIRTALPGRTGDVGVRMRTAAHTAGPVL